ncbi:conserved hypothetical protein [Paraburkholderia tropica]|uniref:hypothetical protein n=1 Tax=Paraburkholderia tropica TaxID=92647 RepID=UPI001CB492BF|nr:hypothetical protein [Paraburkholderia tropica]CAG9236916.1 conserved hypothetical protein [Paraburkholderia tropica]
MPLINLWHEPRADGPYTPLFRTGAVCSLSSREQQQRGVHSYETHHGLCLFEREYNGYDDSDFYMTYWDEQAGMPVEVMFGTTRGSCGPCMGSSVDATPEVKAKYEVWCAERERAQYIARRAEKARQLRAARATDRELAELSGGARALRVRSLRRIYGPEKFAGIERLLRTRKFRSSFRENIAKQIRDWLVDPTPPYPTPLSKRQVQYI